MSLLEKRIKFICGISLLPGFVVFLCVAGMQTVMGDAYISRAAEAATDTVTLPALRGSITDCNGAEIASCKLCLSVEVGAGVTPEAYKKVCKILKLDKEQYVFGEPFVIRDVSSASASEIAEETFDNVHIIKDYKREYAPSVKLGHVTGYTGIISSAELEELRYDGYLMSDVVGKAGVEKYSEKYLRGADGKRVLKNDNVLFERKPVNGCDVRLTIDKGLQEAVEAELDEKTSQVEAETGYISGGAVVVLDVNSGAVLSMASNPDYNPEDVYSDYKSLVDNPANPLLNRCISGAYEPGSTFKPLVALAGLNEGVITPGEIIEDLGVYTYYAPTYTPSCHIWNEQGKTHGNVTVEKALSESCNYYFYETGRRLGIDAINKYASDFGFGEQSGIELEGEQSGILASPDEKEWYAGDTLQAAIGQSLNMFTPLQMAAYTAAIANGGKLYRPYVINCVETADGELIEKTGPKVRKANHISEKYMSTVREGMRQCVVSGTGAEAFGGAGFECGGKTGTAQVPGGPENGIFIGFAPFEQPEIAVSVVIEHGGGGYSAELAAKIIQKYLELYKNH